MSIDSGPTVRVNPHQVTIWWHSSSSGSSELRWDSDGGSEWAGLSNDVSNTATNLGTVHSRTIANLPAGTYWFRVRTTGAEGTATSTVRRFTVRQPDATSALGATVVGGTVRAVASTPTRTYVGGDFTSIGERLGSGIEVAATSAARTRGTPQVAGSVNASVPDGAGGWYIGGDFVRVGGMVRRGVARLLPDGGLDPYFDPGAANSALTYALAVSNGKLYIGGYVGSWDGVAHGGLVVVNAATARLDPTFTPGAGPDGTVMALTVSGTRLYIGGSFTNYDGTPRPRLAAVDATTGALEPGFGSAGAPDGTVYALAASGGRLYLGGSFTSYAGTARARIAAVNATTGAIDTGFSPGTGVNNRVDALVVTATRLYLGGYFSTYNGVARSRIAAADPTTGLLDAGFDPGTGFGIGIGSVHALAPNASGTRLFVGGNFATYGGTARPRLLAVDAATAAIDVTFNPGTGPNDVVRALAVSGTVLHVGGDFSTYGGIARTNVASIVSATGTLDTAFSPGTGPNSAVYALALNGTRLYVGGFFTSFSGAARPRLAALDTTTGALDTGFLPGTGPDGAVLSMAVVGTRLFIGGDFTTYAGASRPRIAAVSPTTAGLDTGFVPGTGADASVRALATDGTRVYLGGDFTLYNGAARARVAAVNPTTGALDPTFAVGTGANGQVRSLLVAGTRLYVGGYLTSWNGTARSRVAAVSTTTGALDAGFDPGSGGVGGSVNAMVASGGRLYLGGGFTSFGGSIRGRVAVVDAASGLLLHSPDVGAGANASVEALGISGARLDVGGAFRTFGEVSQGGLAALTLDPQRRGADAGPLAFTSQPTHAVAPYQVTISWRTSASSSSELVWDTTPRTDWRDYANDVSNTATGLGLQHSRTISNLGPGTYFYRVRSRTAGGEQVTSTQSSFHVDASDASTPLGTAVAVGGNVNDVELIGDRAVIAGAFTHVATRSGAAVRLDAASGERRPGMPQVAGHVHAAISDGAGGMYIAGNFVRVGGLPRNRIARLLPDGGVDPTFAPPTGASDIVMALALTGGRLYIGGRFTNVNGTTRSRIAALDPTTGATDPTFAPAGGANDTVVAIHVTATRVYVAGPFTTVNGVARARLASLDAVTGALDTTFNPGTGPSSNVYALTGTATRLYVGGVFTSYAGTARNRIAAVDAATGALDPGFDPGAGPNAFVDRLALANGRLYLSGAFTTYAGTARGQLAAVNTTSGALDLAFNPGTGTGGPTVTALAVDATSVAVGGSFASFNGAVRDGVATLDPVTGAVHPGFALSAGAGGSVEALVLDGGTLLVAGRFSGFDAVRRPRLAAIEVRSGELDVGFDVGAGPDGEVHEIAAANGRIYLAGQFLNVNGTSRPYVAAVNSTSGAVDVGFATGTGPSSMAHAIHATATRVYVGGAFTTVNGTTRAGIAALNPTTGAVELAFNPGTGAAGTVDALAVVGNRLYLGGSFTTLAGASRTRIGALDATTGALDTSFLAGGGADSTVRAFTSHNGSLYAAGSFGTIGGLSRGGVARLDPATGAVDPTFAPTGGSVYGIAAHGPDVAIAGGFLTYGGQPREGLAILDGVTGSTTSYQPTGTGLRSIAETLRYGGMLGIASTGTHVVGVGYFGAYNDVAHQGVAVLDTCDRSTFCTEEALRDYLTLSAPEAVSLPTALHGASSTATLPVTVRSNALLGYSLHATDPSDRVSLTCTTGKCAGSGIPDWTGPAATPTTWPESGTNDGFGVAVLATTLGAKLAAWGTGASAADHATNRFVGLRAGASALLHRTDRYLGTSPDVTTLALRARISATQPAGTYSGTMTITAVANP